MQYSPQESRLIKSRLCIKLETKITCQIIALSPFYTFFFFSKRYYLGECLVFAKSHNILIPSQHSFRKHILTETALLTQIELILQFLEEKLLTFGIFIGFSKAFDRINCKIMSAKLERYTVFAESSFK